MEDYDWRTRLLRLWIFNCVSTRSIKCVTYAVTDRCEYIQDTSCTCNCIKNNLSHKHISGYPQGKQTLKTQVLTKSMNISNLVIATLTHYNPLLLFYTPWKHQITFRFSDVFRGCRKETPGCHGLNQLFIKEFITQIKFKKTKY